jgi:hypothetical protein
MSHRNVSGVSWWCWVRDERQQKREKCLPAEAPDASYSGERRLPAASGPHRKGQLELLALLGTTAHLLHPGGLTVGTWRRWAPTAEQPSGPQQPAARAPALPRLRVGVQRSQFEHPW